MHGAMQSGLLFLYSPASYVFGRTHPHTRHSSQSETLFERHMLAMTLLGSVLVTPARLYFLSATRWHFSAHTSLAFAFERQTVALLCTSLKPARLWLSSAAHLALRSHRLGFQLRCTRHLLDLDSRVVLRHIARSGRAEPDDDGDADEDHRGERRHDNAEDALVPVGCVIATITSRRHGINAWLHPRNGRPIGTPHTAHLSRRVDGVR
jgi:hypothetical protein